MKSEYSAKQIDRMEIEDLEQLAYNLSEADRLVWADWGYSGEKYVELIEAK